MLPPKAQPIAVACLGKEETQTGLSRCGHSPSKETRTQTNVIGKFVASERWTHSAWRRQEPRAKDPSFHSLSST
jgi:hypothetical protein